MFLVYFNENSSPKANSFKSSIIKYLLYLVIIGHTATEILQTAVNVNPNVKIHFLPPE